ncbi:MAG: class I SAM-dependent methyltransferase [Anaerolineae bacterium]|nr:class I SAM-dependent methyltransferase [Anaerolineae bacterium]
MKVHAFRCSGYFTEEVRKAAITKARLQSNMIVADVGAGTGFMAAGLAPLVDQIVVVDGSAAMLETAKKNLSSFKNVSYQVSNGHILPIENKSIDVAFANMYLHHCPDPLGAIQEMVRILKPGGRLVITDLEAHPYTWMKEEMADEWMGFDRSQIKDWFQAAGLSDIDVDCTGQSCCAETSNSSITNEQDRQAKISVFVATGVR